MCLYSQFAREVRTRTPMVTDRALLAPVTLLRIRRKVRASPTAAARLDTRENPSADVSCERMFLSIFKKIYFA